MKISIIVSTIILGIACIVFQKYEWTDTALNNKITTEVLDQLENECQFKGIPLYGKVQIVDAFPDIKVQVVDAFPDIKVKWVDHFADECGKWEEVDVFPDFKIQYVDAFPDIKVKWVDHFPGVDR